MTDFQKKGAIGVIVLIIAVLVLPVFFSGTWCKTPGQKQRPRVLFSHDAHMITNDCLACHHEYKNGENISDQAKMDQIKMPETAMLLLDATVSKEGGAAACSACHNPKAKIPLMDAFHRQCIGCHDRPLTEKKSTGPVLCGECHIENCDKQ